MFVWYYVGDMWQIVFDLQVNFVERNSSLNSF